MIDGLVDAGVNVIDLGAVTSPMSYFAAHTLEQCNSCIVITASHNPKQYNGFKFVCDGQPLFGDAISELYFDMTIAPYFTATVRGTIVKHDIYPSYQQSISDRFQPQIQPLSIVVDAGNSITGAYAPRLLHYLGIGDLTELYCEPDGNFPNHHPDPANPDNLKTLIATCIEHKRIGIAFDGDGDRLGVVDELGRIVPADYLILLFVKALADNDVRGTIIYDVKCSAKLESEIQSLGMQPIMYRTGHSYIKNKMVQEQALFAGEVSGHFFFSHNWFGFDDGILAAVQLLNIVAGSGKTLAELTEPYRTEFLSQEHNVICTAEDIMAFEKMVAAAEHAEIPAGILEHADDRVITIDGIRIESQKSWGIVRASNTSSKLVVRYGGESEDHANQIASRIKRLIEKIVHSAHIPWHSEKV